MKNLTQISPDCNLQLSDLHDYPLDGIHHHHMKLARYLVSRGMDPQEASRLIHDKFNERPRRRVLDRDEIEEAVLKASRTNNNSDTEGRGVLSTRIIPRKTSPESFWHAPMELPFEKPNNRAIQNVIKQTPMTVYDLWESSLIRLESVSPFEIIQMLYSADELVCCGKKSNFDTKMTGEWQCEKNDFTHICPNPNRVTHGINTNGELSAHCRDATGRRRYIVVESDSDLTFDEKASVIVFLQVNTEAKLKMVVHSAGKSLHAWFKASDCEYKNWQFINFACLLGADNRMWLPEQFARLPNAQREGTELIQKCIYFDPYEN